VARPGTLEYYCRRCGRPHRGPRVPDIETAMVHLTMGNPTPAADPANPAPLPLGVHVCADAGLGVLELLGATPD
jgi:hypothetical protein